MASFDILDGGACEGRGFCGLRFVGYVVRGGVEYAGAGLATAYEHLKVVSQ